MADITMCQNKDCPLSYSCWRYNAPRDRYQSYYDFKPRIDTELDEVECHYYLKPPEGMHPADKKRIKNNRVDL